MKVLGKINIVGVDYTLYYYENEFEKLQNDAKERDTRYMGEPRKDKIDGYCDYMSKEIRIFNDEYTNVEYFKMTLRHEICHAFLYEIGNSNCDDEDFIDKLSKWSSKIMEIFNEGLDLLIEDDDECQK